MDTPQLQPTTPINVLPGIGPIATKQLEKLNITTIHQLLFHLPLRYQDRTQRLPIHAVKPDSAVAVVGKIMHLQLRQVGPKRLLICRIEDETGQLDLCFYHASSALQHRLKPGGTLYCFGDIRLSRYGMQMIHPDYQLLNTNQSIPLTSHLTPIYPTIGTLKQSHWKKWLTTLWRLIDQQRPQPWLEELLPPLLREKYQLEDLQTALRYLHAPPIDAHLEPITTGQHPFQRRLIFEELLAHALVLHRLRHQIQQKTAKIIQPNPHLQIQLLAALPFSLTNAQTRVLNEIEKDLMQPQPMLRLVQGDVGSGKTIVAALSSLLVIANHYQVAFMAPTELLVEQHAASLQQWFAPLGLTVACLSGKLKKSHKQSILENVESGKIQMLVGTHALFQKAVKFNKLGLLIIDEQHRFGVHQRLALQQKGIDQHSHPHQLIMTATPIPRSLAMSAYADLDLSIIDERPPGRTAVKTLAIANHRRDEVIARIGDACQRGHQAYWVCTRIETSDSLQAEAAEKIYEALCQTLPQLKIALLHGRMTTQEKTTIMQQFKAKQFDLLVSTTVIEVGVDVPNASLMIIENAERLGLSQLHQLRGRVGRGSVESHCLLMYQPPLSQTATKRLTMLRHSNDGFAISELDLKLRGPGEFLGTRQTGLLQMRIADLTRDSHLLPEVRQAAQELLAHHPIALTERIIERWLGDDVHHYAQV